MGKYETLFYIFAKRFKKRSLSITRSQKVNLEFIHSRVGLSVSKFCRGTLVPPYFNKMEVCSLCRVLDWTAFSDFPKNASLKMKFDFWYCTQRKGLFL